MDHVVVQPTRTAPTGQTSFEEAWTMAAEQLRLEMKRADYETWVSGLRPLSFKEGVFRVGAVNSFARDWVESRLRTRISRLLESIFHQPVTVHFTMLKSNDPEPANEAEPAAAAGASAVTADLPAEREAEPAESAPSAALPAKAPEISGASAGKKKRGVRGTIAPRHGDAIALLDTADLSLAEVGLPNSPRKIQLQRAYGTERARVIQPERGMFLTMYFFSRWLPLLGHSAMTTVLAARSLCYWNPMTGELRNVIETDMGELARRADVSVRTIKDVLNNELVRKYFLRYKVRRVMTSNGVRTAGILLQVRMDDPLTPEDQDLHRLAEEEQWYTGDFEDENEE
jgi:hypothetical protein